MGPIDGTRSFIHCVPLYATLLAYQVDGVSVFGAISLPSLGTVVYAEQGAGCWRDVQRISVSDRDILDGAHLLATWLEDWESRTIDPAHRAGAVVRTWGDAFGYVLVASGAGDAIIDYTAQIYDLAPLPVITEEAGGRFTSLSESGVSTPVTPSHRTERSTTPS